MPESINRPGGVTHTPGSLTGNNDKPSSPEASEPLISRKPDQTSKSILRKRSAEETADITPRVNPAAREKVERVEEGKTLVANLESLLAQQQFLQHFDTLKQFMEQPQYLPSGFSISYIDSDGREVALIPPSDDLLQNPARETQLLEQLKQEVTELDQHYSEDKITEVGEAISTTGEQLNDCISRLAQHNEPLPDIIRPDRIVLHPDMLTIHQNPAQPPQQEVFYAEKNVRIPGQQYSLDDISNFNDRELENNHDYIQLLFPNRHISPHNPGAPRLTDALIREFWENSPAKGNALALLDKMLSFWGIERDDHQFKIIPGETERHKMWALGDNNHNHKRITRLLNFLGEVGYGQAKNLEATLQQHRRSLNSGTQTYWANAVNKLTSPTSNPEATIPTSGVTAHDEADSLSERFLDAYPDKDYIDVRSYQDYIDAHPYDQCHKPKIEFSHLPGPYAALSALHVSDQPLIIVDDSWPTIEHYYQACKFTPHGPEWNHIKQQSTVKGVLDFMYPKDSERPIMRMTIEEWSRERDNVMLFALRAKAEQVKEFRDALLKTGDNVLFDTSNRDSYWSIAIDPETNKPGKNCYGAILMQVRDELRAGLLESEE